MKQWNKRLLSLAMSVSMTCGMMPAALAVQQPAGTDSPASAQPLAVAKDNKAATVLWNASNKAKSTDNPYELQCDATPSSSNHKVYLGYNDYETFRVEPEKILWEDKNGKEQNVFKDFKDFTYVWKVNSKVQKNDDDGGSYSSFTLHANDYSYRDDLEVSCKISAVNKNTNETKTLGTEVWYVYIEEGDYDVSITVSEDLGKYYFSDSGTISGNSIRDQIEDHLEDCFGGNDYYDSYVKIFYDSGSSVATLHDDRSSSYRYLHDLDQVYLELKNTGTWHGSYEAYKTSSTSSTPISGSITVRVEDGDGSGSSSNLKTDIVYTAALGEDVDLNIDDFHDFWSDYTNGRGSLKSVRITNVSVSNTRGSLWYTGGNKDINASGQTFYVDPKSSQYSLSSLRFRPTQVSNRYKSGTVTISFTATGTRSSSSSSSSYNSSTSGYVSIIYTNGDVDSINYTITSGETRLLRTSDFTSVYRKATGTSTSNPSFTIRFLDLPSYGTLYANYSTTSYNQISSSATRLTENNKSSRSFSSKASSNSSTSIDRIAYIPNNTSVADTARYVAYNGSNVAFVGTITFGVQNLEITYTSTISGVQFRSSDFLSVLASGSYLTFNTPSFGSLYTGYNTTSQMKVTSNDRFSYVANTSTGVKDLSIITYVPGGTYSGVVEIPFTATVPNGGKVTGKVKITVEAKKVNFTDMGNHSWAVQYVNRAAEAGIIDGTTPTTFSPGTNVTYGQALKMLLLAAGYSKQTELTGANWAQNYLTLAKTNGIISGNVDLNADIDRNAVAAIAAKALRLTPATSIGTGITPPIDSKDGYVYALYNARIVSGDSSGDGQNRYNGSAHIVRAEISKIICNMLDYKNK